MRWKCVCEKRKVFSLALKDDRVSSVSVIACDIQ